MCAAYWQQAGNPDQGAIVVLKASNWLGAHFYMCKSCTDLDPRFAEPRLTRVPRRTAQATQPRQSFTAITNYDRTAVTLRLRRLIPAGIQCPVLMNLRGHFRRGACRMSRALRMGRAVTG